MPTWKQLRSLAVGATVGLALDPAGTAAALTTALPEGAPVRASSIVVPRAPRPPVLDEYVAGEPADAGLKISEFVQYAPSDGQPASLPTTAYLSYDERNLYVVFVCKGDPAQVRTHLGKREDIFGDDGVELFLDTFYDRQRAYVFAVNPFGVQLDGVYAEGQGYEFDFDTLWYSDGKLTPDGYVAAMTLPWKSLRFPRAPSQRWGFALARIVPRNNEFSYAPQVTQRISGFVNQYGSMEIPESISPGRNIQLIPYAAGSRARILEDREDGAAYRTTDETRVGLDAKLVLGDAAVVDLTLKPDFSQVESDEPQVIVNQRFEVFFPEKRPFFLENASFFSLPINLFFSRRIAEPEYGARLTGKAGNWAYGALVIDDVSPGEAGLGELFGDDRAEIGVARVQRSVGEQSNFGLLASERRLGDGSNRVVSADGRWQLSRNWFLTGQAAASRTGGDGDDVTGTGLSAAVTREGLHFNYSASYLDLDRDFQTDLGFVPRVDIRQLSQSVSYLWWPEESKLVNHGPTLDVFGIWDQDGEQQDWDVTASYAWSLKRQTNFSVSYTEAFERFLGIEFRKDQIGLNASSEPLSWLTGSLFYARGDGVNFLPAGDLEPFLGTSQTFQLGLTFKLLRRLRIDQTYIYTDLRTQGPVPPVTDEERTVFVNSLYRSKVNYQFNRSFSLRLILDYQSLSPTPSLIALERDKRLVGDLLFTYLLNPGTAIYVGYTDRYANVDIVPTVPPSLLLTDSASTSVGRQVFVKVSYLFRF